MRKVRIGRPSRQIGEDVVFDAVNAVVLCIVAAIFLLPIWYVICCSLSSYGRLSGSALVLWPDGLHLEGYKELLGMRDVWVGYGNSLLVMVLGVVLTLAVTTLAAYPLAEKRLMFRGVFIKLMVVTMFVSGGLIPTYLVVKSLGLINSRLALVLPGMMNVAYMIILRTSFMSADTAALRESAEIDGASDFQTLIRIVLPLTKPILMVIAMYVAVAQWNSYETALYYLSDRSKFPLQLILRDYIVSDAYLDTLLVQGAKTGQYGKEQLGELAGLRLQMKFALIVIGSLPVALLYPFIQKYFVKGIMVGSLKG